MAWPSSVVTIANLSNDAAQILLARPELYNIGQAVNDIIQSRGVASGVASLDIAGFVPVTQLPPNLKSYGSIHLDLESATGKVIIKDFLHLTPYTQAQLDAKVNNTIGDLAISTDGDAGNPGISIWDGSAWKSTVSTTTLGPRVAIYDVDITNNTEVTFNLPIGITRAKVTVIGGGGGGGAAQSNDGSTVAAGGLGGAGAIVVATFDNLTDQDNFYITVGAGGAGGDIDAGDSTGYNGENGFDSVVSLYRTDSTIQTITAGGGNGGLWSDAGQGTNGTGGTAETTNIATNKAIKTNGNPASNYMSGGTAYGPYVLANDSIGAGTSASKYGAGGGNGYDTDSTGYDGGAGSSGLVIIEY